MRARCDTVTTDVGHLTVDVLDGDGFIDGDRLAITLSNEAGAAMLDAGLSCDIVSTYGLERVGRD